MYSQQGQSVMKGTSGGLCSFPSVLCVVLEASEAHEDLLQGDLAHRIVFQAIFLFGFLQGPEDLRGRARPLRQGTSAVGEPSRLRRRKQRKLFPRETRGKRNLPWQEGGGKPGDGLFSRVPDPI